MRSDVAVLGAGPGGYIAAIRAAQLGLRTTVIEADRPGGVCLNWGCIPSKALLTGAELVENLRSHGDTFGIGVTGLTLDYDKLITHSRKTADRLAKGVEGLFKKNAVTLVRGRGRLAGAGRIDVAGGEGIEATNVILATGSREVVLPGLDVDGKRVLTSREALESRVVPQRLIVVGAGAVGLEFAYVYAMYGARVTVVEMARQVLPGCDPDVAEAMQRELRRKQIEVKLGARFEACKTANGGMRVTISQDGAASELEAEQVLIAVGRRPLSDDLGLETIGLAPDTRGFVSVDAQLRTAAPGVYAIGDVAQPPLLAHKASEEGVAAAEGIAGLARPPIDHRKIPACIYTQPQVAWIGLGEAQAKAEHGPDLLVGKFPFTASGKAVAAAHTAGFVKVLAEPRYREIVGAHVIGAGATELIAELALAMTLEATTREIAATSHAHPTLAEAILEAALAAEGRGLNF